MAWGMSFINKLTLSLVRTVAIIVLLCYLRSIIKAGTHRLLYIYMVALVTTGAIGNMIDSMFYGLIFTSSEPFYVAKFVPFGQGYSAFMMGKVVDMFRFPLHGLRGSRFWEEASLRSSIRYSTLPTLVSR